MSDDLRVKRFFEEDVQRHLDELRSIEETSKASNNNYTPENQAFVNRSVRQMEIACKNLEESLSDPEQIENAKKHFREEIKPFYFQSYFMRRGTEKPRGYPGDCETLEGIYDNQALSRGIGFYLDNNFLSQTLAVAIRNRKDLMGEIISESINSSDNQEYSAMNIASGSCREWYENLDSLQDVKGLRLTCIDFDQESLDFAKTRLASLQNGGANQLDFLNQNVINIARQKTEKNKELYGEQDFIYSIGLYDYLPDKLLTRLITRQHDLLKPDGRMVLAFKDKMSYEKTCYDWTTDWRFEQRDKQEIESLLDKSGISPVSYNSFYEPSGTVIFYDVRKD